MLGRPVSRSVHTGWVGIVGSGELPARDVQRADIVRRFGAKVRGARESRGWTQQDLADLTGIDRVTISLIESGAREPGVSRVVVPASALGVDPGDFFGN